MSAVHGPNSRITLKANQNPPKKDETRVDRQMENRRPSVPSLLTPIYLTTGHRVSRDWHSFSNHPAVAGGIAMKRHLVTTN